MISRAVGFPMWWASLKLAIRNLLLHKMQEFYAVQKDCLAIKANKLVQNVEASRLHEQYKALQHNLARQQKHWQSLLALYAG